MEKKTAEKLDLRKQLKHLYLPSAKSVAVVDVPQMKFISIDGRIEPGMAPGTSPIFQQAMGALYAAAYTLKFTVRFRPADPIDYPVMALEGLWGTPGGGADWTTSSEWEWTMMIMQPDFVTQDMFTDAVAQARKKRDNPYLDKLALVDFREGLSIQILHVGSYADEPRTIQRMDTFAAENGYKLHGRHHEIYLGDPRKAKPENLKTVLRHPVVADAG